MADTQAQILRELKRQNALLEEQLAPQREQKRKEEARRRWLEIEAKVKWEKKEEQRKLNAQISSEKQEVLTMASQFCESQRKYFEQRYILWTAKRWSSPDIEKITKEHNLFFEEHGKLILEHRHLLMTKYGNRYTYLYDENTRVSDPHTGVYAH